MSFDGRNYQSVPVVPPYAHHPGAPATAEAFSAALEIAYSVARLEHRLVGIQTSNRTVGSGFTVIGDAYYAAYDQITDVARFRKRMPPWATHLVFEAYSRAFSTKPFVIASRVVATDGTIDSTGETIRQFLDPFEGGERSDFEGFRHRGKLVGGFTALEVSGDDYGEGLQRSVGEVELDPDTTLPGMLTIRVQQQAYSQEDTGDGVGLFPEMITVWMETRG